MKHKDSEETVASNGGIISDSPLCFKYANIKERGIASSAQSSSSAWFSGSPVVILAIFSNNLLKKSKLEIACLKMYWEGPEKSVLNVCV